MSNEDKNPNESQRPIQFNWTASTGDKAAEGLKGGLEAFGKLLEGIVKMAQGVGAESLRNQQAAHWLGQIATSLEEAVKTARETGKCPEGKNGEMACYLERLEDETKGTKYETQIPAFRQRLEQAGQLLDSLDRLDRTTATEQFSENVKQLSNIAGYFRGAAGPKETPSTVPSADATGS